jgi:hypothetical protein
MHVPFGALLNLWSAAQVDNPYVKAVGLAAGTAETFGGTIYFGGALTSETQMTDVKAGKSREFVYSHIGSIAQLANDLTRYALTF